MAKPRLDRLHGLGVPNEQRCVEVPQGMKAEPLAESATFDRRTPDVGEAGTADRLACIVGKHKPRPTPRGTLRGAPRRKCIHHDRRERHYPARRVGLGRYEPWSRTGHQYEMSVDSDGAAEEVESIDGQSETLSLSEPCSGREYNQG